MKNKVLTTVLLILAPFVLTACTLLQDLPVIGSLFKPKEPEQVTLTMWGLWENPEVMDKLIAKYQEQKPNVTISYDDRSVLSLSDYRDAVFTRADQEDAPDIVRVHNSWITRMPGKLAPVPSDIFSAESYSQSFYPVATEEAAIDGEIYGVPLHYDGLVMVYNIDHFNEIDQASPPTAWEEFRRVAAALRKEVDGQFVRAGAAVGAADNIDFFGDILGLMFVQAGITSVHDFDSVPAQHALLYYVNFMREDQLWHESFPEATTAFAQEQVSIIFIPTWNLLDIIKARPDLNIGVAPVPQAEPNKPKAWATFWMEAVPIGSKNQKAAWDFLAFLAQEEQQLMLFNEASNYREYGAPYSLVSLRSQLVGNDYIRPLLDTADFASSNVIACRSGNVVHIEALKKAVNRALRSNASAEQALKEAKDAILVAP
ncbi:extracellular solute-binding protein [bacterium]|nr:extracellular solute-binding protein [bacterium]